MAELTTKSITGANSWTETAIIEGYFNLSIYGTFVATVTVQRTFDKGNTWIDVDTFTAPYDGTGFEPEYCRYRVGVKTGEYTSGTINVRLGHEDRETH